MKKNLMNPITNAVQAMPSGGGLKPNGFQSGGQPCIVVENNGIGISAEVLAHLFKPFFTKKPKVGGAS